MAYPDVQRGRRSTATASAARGRSPQRRTGHAAGNVGGYAEVMNVTATQGVPGRTDLPDQWLSLLRCGIIHRAQGLAENS